MEEDKFHQRATDNMPYPHERISDPVLVDLLANIKINNSKLESVVADVGHIRKSNENIKERLSNVESSHGTLENEVRAVANKVESTNRALDTHTREEAYMLKSYGTRLEEIEDVLDSVKRGFPKNDDGERDPRSHADDHEVSKKKSKSWAELWVEVRKWATIAFLASSLSLIGYLIVSGSKVELTKAVQPEAEVKK